MSISHSLFEECERHQQATDELRNRALERLYTRRAVVDELIRSLETYERFPVRKGPAQCIPIRKCS
jgi:predicted nucleic acid-binding protein